MKTIEVKDVSKYFKIYKRQKGLAGTLKALFSNDFEIKKAVDNISFSIQKGELVGFIGPNGAGKSTTIKMLCGILLPSSGEIMVNGRTPFKEREKNAMNIGVVFGQRSQLYWDLPIIETFDLYQKMYRIDENRYQRNLEFYIELLGMEEFLHVPVRQLSLGQKMRANLAIALLHDPEIVYLDEPTIGLDIVAKDKIRNFIREVNREKNITVILTTHDMDDIECICNKLIMIDKGKIIYDGLLSEFKGSYCHESMLIIDAQGGELLIEDPRLKMIKEEGSRKIILYDKRTINSGEAISLITRKNQIVDLTLKEPEIEEVIKKIYEGSIITD
jgi:ABC-2 type transport system ATP-binding protein